VPPASVFARHGGGVREVTASTLGAVLLAAAAGGLGAAGAREALLASPQAARWVRSALEPLRRAGREGYAPTDVERSRLATLGTLALLAAGIVLTGPGPAPLLAAAGPVVATTAVSRRRRSYARAVERGLPGIALAIADALAAGRSPRAALAIAAGSLEGPPATEMSRVRAELALGASTRAALDGLRRRLESRRVDAFCAALLSQQVAGGDLAVLLRRFAVAAADRDRTEADARSATAQARFTGLLVVAMPAGAALLAELLEPGFVAGLLADPAAAMLLALAAGLQVAGFAAIRRLSRIGER
jgi:tight adherence protein B